MDKARSGSLVVTGLQGLSREGIQEVLSHLSSLQPGAQWLEGQSLTTWNPVDALNPAEPTEAVYSIWQEAHGGRWTWAWYQGATTPGGAEVIDYRMLMASEGGYNDG